MINDSANRYQNKQANGIIESILTGSIGEQFLHFIKPMWGRFPPGLHGRSLLLFPFSDVVCRLRRYGFCLNWWTILRPTGFPSYVENEEVEAYRDGRVFVCLVCEEASDILGFMAYYTFNQSDNEVVILSQYKIINSFIHENGLQ